MKPLLLSLLLISSCTCPPPKVISTPEVGMGLNTFWNLCGGVPDHEESVTTEQGVKLTLKNNPTNYRGEAHPVSCVGTFTFVNGKLETITR